MNETLNPNPTVGFKKIYTFTREGYYNFQSIGGGVGPGGGG
jgi:hypothetical protein